MMLRVTFAIRLTFSFRGRRLTIVKNYTNDYIANIISLEDVYKVSRRGEPTRFIANFRSKCMLPLSTIFNKFYDNYTSFYKMEHARFFLA